MKLTKEQNRKVLRELGIWVADACDKCGQLIGSIRWSRYGERGEWCSGPCRDGIATCSPKLRSNGCLECGVKLDGKRADADFCSRTHMMRYRRRKLSATAQKREIIGNTPIAKQELRGAQNVVSTNMLTAATEALETACSERCAR